MAVFIRMTMTKFIFKIVAHRIFESPILKFIRARDRAIDHASTQINGHNDDGHRHVQPGVVRHHQSQYIQIFHCFMLMLQCLRRGIVS